MSSDGVVPPPTRSTTGSASAGAGAGSGAGSEGPPDLPVYRLPHVKEAVLELASLAHAVDVPAAADKTDVDPDKLVEFLKAQASQLHREASRCGSVLGLPTLDESSAKFVTDAITGPAALLVSGCQLLVRHAGPTRAAAIRNVVRNVVQGCIGLLQQFVHGVETNKTAAVAAGMLWQLCDTVKTLPKSDAVATKRILMQAARVTKDSLSEFEAEMADATELGGGAVETKTDAPSSGPSVVSCMRVLKGTLAMLKSAIGVVNDAAKVVTAARNAKRAETGDKDLVVPPDMAIVLGLDGLAKAGSGVEDGVVDFADAMNDLGDEEEDPEEAAAAVTEAHEALLKAVAATVTAVREGFPADVVSASSVDGVVTVGERLKALAI